MKEVFEEMKNYLETTPLEEVVRTWLKYNTLENNVGATMEEFLDNNLDKDTISPLEVLEIMRSTKKIDFKYITIDIDGICVWKDEPVFSEFFESYMTEPSYVCTFSSVEENDYHNKTIDWKGQTIYSLE